MGGTDAPPGLTGYGGGGGTATMISKTTAILEAAEKQVVEEFGEGATFVGEVLHHLGRARDLIDANTGPDQ